VLIGSGSSLVGYANVELVDPTGTTITVKTGSLPTYASATATVFMGAANGLGTYPGQGVYMSGVNISGNALEMINGYSAITAELTEALFIDSIQVTNMGLGTCLQFLGTLKSNVYGLHCNVDGNGLILEENSIGSFIFTGSNADRFYGVDIENGNNPTSGVGLIIGHSGGDYVSGLHMEGNSYEYIAVIGYTGSEDIQIVDWEANTATSPNYELSIIYSSDVHLHGPTQFESSSSSNGIGVNNSTDVVVDQFSITGNYSTAFNSIAGSSTGKLDRVINNTSPLAAMGTAGFIIEDFAGNFTPNNIISTGAQTLSASGCTISGQVGGSSAGSFRVATTTGTCTVTITPIVTPLMPPLPVTAPNGWACDAHDITNPAIVISQTGSVPATATISGSMLVSDTITWKCIGF